MYQAIHKLIILWIVYFIFGSSHIQAQYVRREKFDTEQQRRQQYALDDWISYMQSNIFTSATVGNNYIYFGTLNGGILRYDLYRNFWDYPYTTSNGLSSNEILDVVYEFSTGYLWAVTGEDTCIFKPAEKEWLCKSDAPFWDFRFPEREVPRGGGEIRYNILYPGDFLNLLPNFFANGPWTIVDGWKVMDEYFDEYQITGFLKDDWERIWFTIEGLGLGIGQSYTQRMDIHPYGLTAIHPRVIRYQNYDLWIGGEPTNGPGRSGIVNWRNNDGSWYHYQARWISSLPSDNIRDILVHGDSVWFATDFGLSLHNTANGKWKNFTQPEGISSQNILDLMMNHNTLYVSTDKGLNTVDVPGGVIQRTKDQQINLADVYQITAQRDTIWAATNRGIFRLRDKKKDWESVTVPLAISDVPVIAVESFQDEVWFTSPQGVFWLNGSTGSWQSFPEISSEITGPYFDVEVNSESVWVSTPEGLLKYNRKMQYWKIFTENDGLLDNRCYRLLMDGDYIWIANHIGITQFYWNDPDRID